MIAGSAESTTMYAHFVYIAGLTGRPGSLENVGHGLPFRRARFARPVGRLLPDDVFEATILVLELLLEAFYLSQLHPAVLGFQ